MSAPELTLYSYNISPFAAKVRAVLAWKGVGFREEIVHPLRRGVVVRKSGQVQVPILEHGDRVISDSTRIVAYLDEAFPERRVLPADAADRGRAKLLEEWADEGLSRAVRPVLWLIPMNFERVSQRFRSAYPAGRGNDLACAAAMHVTRLRAARVGSNGIGFGRPAGYLNRLAEVLDCVEGAVGSNGWLVGNDPTVADFAVAGWISVLRGLDGWETAKMRRKTVKLAKALIPEGAAEAAEASAAPKGAKEPAEAYDAEDQALIDASRLRRANPAPM
jgi:glutathione S-transferase